MPYPDAISGALRGRAAHADGKLVYALEGEIDIGATKALHARIAELADATEGDVVLDLSDVSFVDSSGLFTLIVLRDVVQTSGRRFVLAAPQSEVRRVLDLTGMLEFFTIEDLPMA